MKDIPWYEWLYAVTEDGNVWSYKTHKYLKPVNKRWYCGVTLWTKQTTIHQLVAQTYLQNVGNKPQVNHKNGIRTDNRVCNLEWCTCQENVLHGFRSNGRRQSNIKEVQQYDLQGNIVGKFLSLREAQKLTGIGFSNISRSICEKKYQATAWGYIWKYSNS